MRILLTTASCILPLLATLAAAQSGVAQSGVAQSGRVPAIDVHQKNLVDVVRFVEDSADVNVLVDEELRDALVTIHTLAPTSWRECLQLIASEVGADLRKITDHTVRMYMPSRVSLEFKDAPFRDVCSLLARLSDLNIVVPGNLDEADTLVTVSLHDVRCRDALEVITKSVGLVVVEESAGDGWRVSAAAATGPRAEERRLQARLRELERQLAELREELERQAAVPLADDPDAPPVPSPEGPPAPPPSAGEK